MPPKVTILQDRLVHYRVGLFEHLKKLADEKGISLFLIYGQASPLHIERKEEGYLDWGLPVKNRWWVVNGYDLLWQPIPHHLLDSDLIILMQHNRILSNYPLIFGRQRRKSKLAYWGHGKNFQSKNPLGIRERIKRRLIQSVDWWFAYTSMSAEIVEKAGFAPDRITCLNNAIDTRGFRADLASVSAEEIKKAKQRFSISDKSYVGLFCGSIYPDKRPHIMIEIAAIMKANIPDFHFFVIGDGPSASVLAKFSSEYDWLHYLGVKKGREKALFFHLADVVLNPGSVGLHVLEAFAAGLPMVTMADAYHGPESCYLVDGYNGYMTEKSSAGCAARLMELYRDKATYRRICAQALLDAEKYTVEKMSARFIHGIENCLSLS